MQTDKTLLIIHGYRSNSQDNWYPWLKAKTEKMQYHVLTPNLPRKPDISIKAWLEALEKIKAQLEGEVTIVGHSLGALTACHFISFADIRVKKLILVAPVGTSELDWDAIKPYGFDTEDKNALMSFISHAIDWRQLSACIQETVLYLSTNDPYIPLSIQDDYAALKPTVHILENRFHFSDRSGCREVPELLAEF